MVININPISESQINNLFHEAEIFVIEACHEIDMINLQSHYLNEAEGDSKETLKDKANKTILLIKRKIEELTDKAIQAINELYSKFMIYKEDNFIKKNFANRENKSEIESITREETKKYLENNPYYNFPKANEMDYVLNNLRRDLTVAEYMDAHDVSKNYAEEVANAVVYSFLNYSKNDKKDLFDDLKEIKNWRNAFLNQMNDSRSKLFVNKIGDTSKKTLNDRESETPVFKAAMNLYMSTLKCRIVNLKARIAIGKKVIERLNKNSNSEK